MNRVALQVLQVLLSPFLILHPTAVKSAKESTFETENMDSCLNGIMPELLALQAVNNPSANVHLLLEWTPNWDPSYNKRN